MKKIYFEALIILLFFCFNIVIVNASDDVGCTYSRKDATCSEEQFSRDFVADSTFTAIIYFSKKGQEIGIESEELPKLIIDGTQVGYGNNLQRSKNDKVYPGLKIGDDFVSAADYYEQEGCPPYFSLLSSSDTTGFFANTYALNSYISCIFPLVKQEYDENLETKDEQYNCTLYSSNIQFKDYSINVNINYTKKTMNFGNETADRTEKTISAIKSYKDNFDYEQKNKCPINELKVCVMGNYVYTYPKDYDAPIDYCGILDSTQQLQVGDNYCKLFVDYAKKLKTSEKRDQSFYSDLSVLRNFCNAIVKNNNYDSDELSCINMCLKINEYIPDIVFSDSQCGISQKLALYIANIIKWLKYIVPVIVIVLGILDFIKAIASDKDDEMKKAQGRFVKRLIAAALIFIIPFIIEFVLDKMGFEEYVSGCGIIDL